jgi:signal transduction histidine kinase
MREKKRPEFFIDVMGHDINNLNQVILSYLELLQESNRLDNKQYKYLECAIMATRNCASLVKSVKAVHKISAGKTEAGNIDIDDLIRECIRDVPRPADKKVNITFAPPRKGRIVRALPELKLAFWNLISNSIKYSGQEVNIEICACNSREKDRRCFVTAITDDGHGIPDDIKRTLVAETNSEDAIAPGKGLGLYTAKMLAEAFGGGLKIEDRVPGDYRKGAKVTISLPTAEGS